MSPHSVTDGEEREKMWFEKHPKGEDGVLNVTPGNMPDHSDKKGQSWSYL